ncbi:MAG: amino acid ABC transporter ATP-binding protein [Acidobacteriaceae bacterium]|nr:amino acid ABC transporter ATP-binding protein [Acidobacteriaceae bacterium]
MAEAPVTTLLRVKGLKAGYGERGIISAFDLEVERGTCIGIVGYSGCGKTTLFKALTGLMPAEAGDAWLDGDQFLTSGKLTVQPWSLRRHITLVTQQPGLLPHKSVLENLALPQELVLQKSKEEAHAEARTVAKLVGIDAELNAFPSEISGGQLQRAHLARAMVLHPEILLLDEVTSNVDPRTSEAITDALDALRDGRGISFLLVSHDFAIVRKLADRVIFLHKGRNLEEIPVTEFPGGFRDPEAQTFASERVSRRER